MNLFLFLFKNSLEILFFLWEKKRDWSFFLSISGIFWLEKKFYLSKNRMIFFGILNYYAKKKKRGSNWTKKRDPPKLNKKVFWSIFEGTKAWEFIPPKVLKISGLSFVPVQNIILKTVLKKAGKNDEKNFNFFQASDKKGFQD